jgi:hypothetical protein
MRRATRITATVLGLTAGLAGIEHGFSKMLQGNARSEGLMISSIGPLGRLLRFPAVLWPWSLALYVLWVCRQWVIGYLFNDWLLANGYVIIAMVLGTLLLSMVTSYAHDVQQATAEESLAGT